MTEHNLLELIWSEAIELRQPDQRSPLARLLTELVTVPAITLVAHGGADRPFAMMEGTELLPGASLGDILTEELGIDVPRDAVVLIEPSAFADAEVFSGSELGQQLGDVLTDIASSVTGRMIRAEPLRDSRAAAETLGRRPLIRDFGRLTSEFDPSRRQDALRAQ